MTAAALEVVHPHNPVDMRRYRAPNRAASDAR